MPTELWKPGQSGNPAGRPKKAREEAYLSVVREKLSPERLGEVLEELLNDKSWRARMAAVELSLAYTLGKPVQRTESSNANVIEEALQNWLVMKQQAITVVDDKG